MKLAETDKSKGITRRDTLKLSGIALAALVAGQCEGASEPNAVVPVEPDEAKKSPASEHKAEKSIDYIQLTGWNTYSTRFVEAPRFTWKPIPGAAKYRVGIAGSGQQRAVWFNVTEATFDLAPIWGTLPFGQVDMLVHAYDGKDRRLDDGTRYMNPPDAPKRFRKAPGWNGGRQTPLEWEKAMHKNIAFLLEPPRDEVRPYEVGLPRFIWSCVETVGGRRLTHNYPSRNAYFVTCLLRFAAQYPASPLAAEAKRQAIQYGDWLYKHHLPNDYVCSGFPFSTVRDGNVTENASAEGFGGSAEGKHISIDHATDVGQGMLVLSNVVNDRRYLEYARQLAEVYVRLQRADGSWPGRVNPKTGQASNKEAEYSAGAVRIARFLARMDRAEPDERFRKAYWKAITWTLENPVKTKCWQSVYEDVPSCAPFTNLSAADANYAVRMLLHFHKEIPRAAEISREINAFIEDQFVVWGYEDAFGACPAPLVLEQYRCYFPMQCHTANWLMSLAALHAITGETDYLHKGLAAANAICLSQYPNGMFSTWGMDQRFDYPVCPYTDWPCLDTMASEALMIWKKYYDSVCCGKPVSFDSLDCL